MILLNPKTEEARQLFLEGSLVFSKMEQNGFRVDVDYCKEQVKDLNEQMRDIEEKILSSKEGRIWTGKYGHNTKLLSEEQLKYVLYDKLKLRTKEETRSGKQSTNEKVLHGFDLPFTNNVLRLRKLNKVANTYLKNFIDLSVEGYLHPSFNLNLVSTYRSSSSNPNFQNIPIRDKEWKRVLRRAIISRPGSRIVEIDFKRIEVGVSACYHKDPNMIRYEEDLTTDMHRDAAMDCFLLTSEELSRNKAIRQEGKNKFVFPAFYGSYYKQIAVDLWEVAQELELDSTPLSVHLASQGLNTFRQFENHIKSVESKFWGERFKVYAQWKKDYYQEYLQKGYIHMYTGFTCSGFMRRNEVVNYPIQGSAFHVNLKSIILINKELERRAMRTKLIGQIHDSLIADVPKEEFYIFMAIAKRVMTKQIREIYPWLIVPVRIEVEATPVDGSWLEKEEIPIAT